MGKRLRSWLQFAISLSIAMFFGWLADIFLSEGGRQSALSFQRASLESLGSFAPLEMIRRISEAVGSMGETGSFGGELGLILLGAHTVGVAAASIWDLGVLQKIAVVISISVGLYLLTISVLTLLGTLAHRQHRNLLTRVTGSTIFCFIAALLTMTAISLCLWVLKIFATVALYVLGWVTELAGIASIGGLFGFIMVKAVEKLLSDRTERALVRKGTGPKTEQDIRER